VDQNDPYFREPSHFHQTVPPPWHGLPIYIHPAGEDCKSPTLPPTSERIPGQNPEKFGSGNGANSRKNYLFKSVFPENTRFKREKTVQFRSLRKCAKTGLSGSLSRSPMPAGGRYGPKINGVIPAPKNRCFFPGKTGRYGSRCCRYNAGRQPGSVISSWIPIRIPSPYDSPAPPHAIVKENTRH